MVRVWAASGAVAHRARQGRQLGHGDHPSRLLPAPRLDPALELRKGGAAPDFKLVQADAYGIQQLRAGIERYLEEG